MRCIRSRSLTGADRRETASRMAACKGGAQRRQQNAAGEASRSLRGEKREPGRRRGFRERAQRAAFQDRGTDGKTGFCGKKIQTAWPVKRAGLVEKEHPQLSVREQCKILGVVRSALSYKPVGESGEDLRVMRALDEIYTMDPSVGSRRLPAVLDRDYGIKANRKRVQRLRRKMGIETIWCRPRRTSVPDNGHRKYPYLLRGRVVEYADEVWSADITYLPMPRGHAYLCAVMDWHSRKVLGWAVSNTPPH